MDDLQQLDEQQNDEPVVKCKNVSSNLKKSVVDVLARGNMTDKLVSTCYL